MQSVRIDQLWFIFGNIVFNPVFGAVRICGAVVQLHVDSIVENVGDVEQEFPACHEFVEILRLSCFAFSVYLPPV